MSDNERSPEAVSPISAPKFSQASLKTRVISGGYSRILRPVLFRSFGQDPEKIHEWMIHTLADVGSNPMLRSMLKLVINAPNIPSRVAGITFPNPIGIAAGMDKDGLAARSWQALGFGFAELGTVTAQAQPGNDKPRVFRLPKSKALINRMGFNNAGAKALAATLNRAGIFRGNHAAGIPIGISIGKTKLVDVHVAVRDYLDSLDALAQHADYIAINVSSPNTPNLRSLQDGGALEELSKALVARAANLATRYNTTPVPIFVKIAPDLTYGQLDEVVETCELAGISGLIAVNTTISRTGLPAHKVVNEAGGLSGKPLTLKAREMVSQLRSRTSLPIIGVGGIMSESDAKAMFDAGADLIQLYTGFIYSGPALALRICESIDGQE